MSHVQSQPSVAPLGAPATRYRIGVLLYFRAADGRLLLMQRRRPPNAGLWCAVGGKLEMATGESPYECAQREAAEEVGVALQASDLELRCIIAERDYQETGHWLMFVFSVLQPLDVAPASIDEGEFRFFAIEELDTLPMPPMDRRILLERLIGDTSGSLHLLRACSGADEAPSLVVEEERIGGGA